jgi:hypothetical protein
MTNVNIAKDEIDVNAGKGRLEPPVGQIIGDIKDHLLKEPDKDI